MILLESLNYSTGGLGLKSPLHELVVSTLKSVRYGKDKRGVLTASQENDMQFLEPPGRMHALLGNISLQEEGSV